MYSIKVVEQESGIKAATLRKWEERYGFPDPVRSPNGSRAYSESDLNKLRTVKKLLDKGFRPSKILTDNSYFEQREASSSDYDFSSSVLEIYNAARGGRLDVSSRLLKGHKSSLSSLEFAETICAPLAVLIGEGWASGDIPVHIEHALSEQLHSVLTIDQSRFYDSAAPLAVLTTLSNENHTLGLKIANSILNDAGCRTIYLGASLPIKEIVDAATFHHADYVGVSITTNTSPKVVSEQIALLQSKLGAGVKLLLGGCGCAYLSGLPDGTQVLTDLANIYEII